MAGENGYERRVGGASPAGLPQASAAAFGAGIGDGVAAIGGALGRARQVDQQIRNDTEIADFNRQFADLRTAADRTSIDSRTKNTPDHAEALTSWYKDQAASLAEGITDPRARRQAQAQLDEFGGRFETAEYAWAQGARVKKLVADEDAASDLAANRAYRNHDRDALDQELALSRSNIEALAGVPDDTKEALIRRREEKIAFGFLRGQADTSPQTVAALLDSGEFDGLVTPEQQHLIRNTAAAQVRATEAQARAQAAQTVRVEREDLGAAEEGLNAGAGTYQDRLAIAGRYEAIGDKSKAEQWRGKAAQFATVQGTRDLTLPQMDERITTLQGKQNGKGLSTAEAHELAGLRDQRSQSATRLNQPGGALAQYQYATGQMLDPVDFADPASMRRRASQSIAAAQTYGRPTVEPLLDSELPGLKDLMAGNAGTRMKALETIQGFGNPRAIEGAARQIAGAGDGDFRIAAMLTQRDIQRDVLAGAEARKSNPGVLDETKAAVVMQTYYARALGFLPAGYRDDVLKAAGNLFATRRSRDGVSKWDAASDPGRFANAIETVMGRTPAGGGQVRGGIARTAQGIVVVPPDMTPPQLLQRFARSTPADYARASGGRQPRWPDGTSMTRGQFATLLPTAIGGDRYVFRNRDGGVIEDDEGEPYTVSLSELKGR